MMKYFVYFFTLLFIVSGGLRADYVSDDGYDDYDYVDGDYEDGDTDEPLDPFSHILPYEAFKTFKSSSTLKSQGGNSYSVKNLFDGDLSTCWAEGVKGYGEGEWFEIVFNNDVYIETIAIANGYLKNESVYNKNSSPKKLKVTFIGTEGEKYENTYTLDGMEYPSWEIKSMEDKLDSCNWIYLPDPYPGRTVKSIRFTIMDVYPGTKWDDTCISEIFFFKYNLMDN